MSLTIWQTLGNTFYQGDDSRSIRTGGTRGNSDLDLIAPISFGGKGGSGATGFSPSPGQTPVKLQPKDAAPKSAPPQTLKGINRILEEKFGLKTYDARQGKAPANFQDLSNLGKSTSGTPGRRSLGEANADAQRIANNRTSSDAATARRSRLNEIGRGSKGATPTQKGATPDRKAIPSAEKSKPAPTAYKEPPERGSFFPFPGLKPDSPRPASQPKTGTPNPRNSQPSQSRDPRTGMPFPGKPENQPLGDRPSKNKLGNPNAYGIPEGQPGNNYVPNNAWLIGANYQATVEFEYSNGTRTGVPGKVFFVGPVYAIRQKHGGGGPGMIEYYNGTKWLVAGSNSSYGTAGAPYTLVELGALECVRNCGNSPVPGSPPTVAPAPPLKSPKKERPPDFKPIPNGLPTPEPLPPPFLQPQPQPLPAPIQKPQQQPKPDADKEPQKSPSARRNPKPAPKPAVKPIADPTATGSGSFPKPDSTGTPQGSGSPAGGDYAPTTGATPPSPSPTPNYPDPAAPQSRPLPAPTPAPSGAPLPDFDPITDKTPTPIKEPDPVVQFPPFPVAPKLNSGNACKTADPCTQSISSGVDSANKKADDLGKKVKDILDGVDKALQVLDIGLLIKIDKKLGPEVEGGLSGQGKRIFDLVGKVQATASAIGEKLGKFAKWARLGQLVSVLTLITTLHNALMLSRSVGETLLSMLSNGLAVFGIKDDGGNPYELGELIGKSVENMMKETIGTANYTTLSTNFKKANRIYQAAANLGNSIQSMRFSVVSALETIGGWNARIGNALKRSGVVNESSYSWMNPSPNFDNKFTQALERVEDTVSQIDSVASEILSAQETVTQIASQKDELGKSLGLGTEKPQTENQPQKTAAIAAKAVSAAPNIEATDLNKPGV